MKKRLILVPLGVLASAVLVTAAVSQRVTVAPQRLSTAASSCVGAKGAGISGKLPSRSDGGAVVEILPGAYGDTFLEVMRRSMGLPQHGDSPDPALLRDLPAAMRYASLDTSGAFTCRPLPPGVYLVVATTSEHGVAGVEVATQRLTPSERGLATLDAQNFRPLQATP